MKQKQRFEDRFEYKAKVAQRHEFHEKREKEYLLVDLEEKVRNVRRPYIKRRANV